MTEQRDVPETRSVSWWMTPKLSRWSLYLPHWLSFFFFQSLRQEFFSIIMSSRRAWKEFGGVSDIRCQTFSIWPLFEEEAYTVKRLCVPVSSWHCRLCINHCNGRLMGLGRGYYRKLVNFTFYWDVYYKLLDLVVNALLYARGRKKKEMTIRCRLLPAPLFEYLFFFLLFKKKKDFNRLKNIYIYEATFFCRSGNSRFAV